MKKIEKNTEVLRVQPHSEEAEKAVLGSVIAQGNPIIEKVAGWIRKTDALYNATSRYMGCVC